MKVIPVLDLQAGTVVHGVAGQRAHYRPLQSRLASTPAPSRMLEALAGLDAPACYIADLDAITGTGSHRNLYPDMAKHGIPLWIDAGVTTAGDAEDILAAGTKRVIVGLETLPVLVPPTYFLPTEAATGGRLLFSVDLRDGRPVSRLPAVTALDPLPLLTHLHLLGWRHFILLDIARVGTRSGPPLPLVRAVRERFPDIEIVSGGGVRHEDDLVALADAGCDAALVATALHRGAISPDLLRCGVAP